MEKKHQKRHNTDLREFKTCLHAPHPRVLRDLRNRQICPLDMDAEYLQLYLEVRGLGNEPGQAGACQISLSPGLPICVAVGIDTRKVVFAIDRRIVKPLSGTPGTSRTIIRIQRHAPE